MKEQKVPAIKEGTVIDHIPSSMTPKVLQILDISNIKDFISIGMNLSSKKMGKNFSKIPHSEMEKMLHYHWPGNVRELENVIERGTILSDGSAFRVPELGSAREHAPGNRDDMTLKENERRHILWALEKTSWKVRGKGGAAELLDLPASTLAFRMKKVGIQRPKKTPSRET